MLRALATQRNLISVETISPAAVHGAIVNAFPRFIEGVRTYANGLLAPSTPPVFNLVDIKSTSSYLLKANYVQLSPVSAFVPPGLTATYLEYISVMESCVDIVERIDHDVLQPFNTWIAVLLTNPNALNSLRATTDIPGLQWHDLAATRKAIKECFNNSAITEIAYGKVVKRNTDFVEAAKRVNGLTERVSKIDRVHIMSAIESIVTGINRLIENVRSNPEQYQVSGATLDVLAKLTYRAAEEIEYYSVIAYQLQSLTVAINDTNLKLKRILTS